MGKKSRSHARTWVLLLLAAVCCLSALLIAVLPPVAAGRAVERLAPEPASDAPVPTVAGPVVDPPIASGSDPSGSGSMPRQALPAPVTDSPPGPAVAQAPPEKTPGAAPAMKPASRQERPERRGRIAVVIDDVGYNLAELEPFLRFRGKLTVAVIPALPLSGEAARRVKAAGKELLIHVPMQPGNGEDPGPLFLQTGQVGDVEPLMRRFADSVPGAEGINNHMGSQATADRSLMDALMLWMKREGGIFLDSRTTAQTVAGEAARAQGVPYIGRDVFLDVGKSRDEMLSAFRGGMATARSRGSVVMIGHVQNPGVLDILADMTDGLAEQGLAFTGLTELMAAGGDR